MTYDLEDWYEDDGITPHTFADPIGVGSPFPVIVTDLRSDVDALLISVTSVNGQTGAVTIGAADVGAVPITAAGITGGFAPFDVDALTPVEFLPPFVSTIQGSSGDVQLDAADIPFDPTGFTGLLVGKTELQEVTAVVDNLVFTGGTVTSVNLATGVVTLDAADVGAVDLTAVGANDGVAPLDGTGKVPVLNLPPFVATIGGLSGAVDVVGTMVALDESGFVGLLATTPTPDVQELSAKVDAIPLVTTGLVSSVNSQVGVIQLNAVDIPVDSAGFVGNLDVGDIDLQAVADAFDQLDLTDAVSTVNTLTGDVVLTAVDVGALNVDLLAAANGVAPLDTDGFVPYVNLPPLVTSVNTQTGDAVLTSNEIAVDSFGFSGNAAGVATVQDLAIVVDGIGLALPGVFSVNTLTGDVVLTAVDVGAVDLTAVGAVDGVAPLDGAATVPTTNLPDVVFSVNSMGGVVALDAAAIPVDDSGFVGSLVGVTDLQGVSDVLDTFAGGGGGHTLEEAGTPLTQRTNMNFLAPFNLTDNSGANSTEVALDPIGLTLGGTGGTSAPTARTSLGVYSTTEVDTLVNTTAANVGKRVSVVAATTANITIATALNNGDTLDGVTLATGNLVLVKNQTAPAENGVYVVGVSPARDTNFDTWADYPSSLASVISGTAGALTVWLCTSNTGGTLNTTAITYSQIATGGGTMAAQNASAVAITGGTLAGIDSLALDDGVISGATVSGGKIDNATSLTITNSHTITQDPTDGAIGSPISIVQNTIGNYVGAASTGPIPFIQGSFGPQAVVNVDGETTYNYGTGGFGLEPLGIANFLTIRSKANTAMTLTPAWSFVSAKGYIADGATVTTVANDTLAGSAAFIDTAAILGAHTGGFWDGQDYYGFVAQGPALVGHVHLDRRFGFAATDSPTDAFNGLYTLEEFFIDYHGITSFPTRNVTVGEQVGFYCPRLTTATLNYGARFNSGVQIFNDTVTHTAAPTTPLDFASGAIQTFNYTTPSLTAVTLFGTWRFQQAAHAFGALAFLNAQPTLTNISTLSGLVWNHNTFATFGPTYSATTTSISAGTIENVSLSSAFQCVSGGHLAVTDITELLISTSIGSNVTATDRTAITISDAAGSGAITGSNIGLFIDTLTKGTPAGILNLNSSVLQGTVYGGLTASHDLTLASTTHAAKGTILLDNPTVEFGVTNYTVTVAARNALFMDCTVTMNATGGAAGTGNTFRGVLMNSIIAYNLQGNMNGSAAAFADVNTYKNVSGVSVTNLGSLVSFNAVPIINTDTASNAANYVGFNSLPTLTRTTSGTLTLGDLTQFGAQLTVGTGTVVTARTGMYVGDPAGAGAVTTNVAVWIAAQTKGTTNIGFKNDSTTVLSEQVVTVASAAAVIIPTASTIRLNNTTAGSITLTSQPHVADGQGGQEIEIYNGSGQNVVLQDQGTRPLSNLRLTTTTITLTPRASITLKYSSTVGDWREIARAAVI